jgi:hypothetical protein
MMGECEVSVGLWRAHAWARDDTAHEGPPGHCCDLGTITPSTQPLKDACNSYTYD